FAVVADVLRVDDLQPVPVVRSYAGVGPPGVLAGGFRDGPLEVSQFRSPFNCAVDRYGNVFVADTYNHRIRKIDPMGMVSTVAGTGPPGETRGGFRDGPATQARFDRPEAVAVDDAGNLYVADTHNHRIRRIAPDGTVSTLAGD